MSIVPRTPLLWVAAPAALPLLTLAGQENFAGARLIRAYVQEEAELRRFAVRLHH